MAGEYLILWWAHQSSECFNLASLNDFLPFRRRKKNHEFILTTWIITVLCLCFFLTVEFKIISSDQPIIALAGDDVILPCHLRPSISASYMTVMWTRPDLIPEYIHFHQDGHLLSETQNPSYFLRTGLFLEELPRGNVSIKIIKVKISDAGRYICKLPSLGKEAPVQLIVGESHWVLWINA